MLIGKYNIFTRMDEASPVKLFIAALYHAPEHLARCLEPLSAIFGPTDYVSPALPFDVTQYYEKEMGAPLFRAFVSFNKMIVPSLLPDIKIKSILLEKTLSASDRRTINLDSGYLDFDKVVLASTKRGPYKIYMKDGIWADMTLHYEKGAFHPFAWTFADFKDGRYNTFLLHIRELFKKQTHTPA